MGKWVYALSVSWLILYGCATSDALKTMAVSERNVNNLARLNLGMSESQVLCIMRDPYREEVFHSSDDQYDVWFYITQPTAMSQTRMVPFNLTPLTFRNKMLIGMGYDYYHWLKHQSVKHKNSTPAPPPEAPKKESKIEESIQNAFSFQEPETTEVSMSSAKKEEPEVLAEEPESTPPSEKTIEINEKDNEMIQDESDQNFNFW